MTIVSTLGKLALTAALGVAVAGTALTATSAPAEAGRRIVVIKHKPFIGHGFHRIYRPHVFVSGYGYGGCYHLKRKALATGSPFWWSKYHACIGY